MDRNIKLLGNNYSNVPAVNLPVTPTQLFPDSTVACTQSGGSSYGYYGVISGGSTVYRHEAIDCVVDGVSYHLPLDPDVHGWSGGYLGYGACYGSASSMDYSTYDFRIENEDGAGSWRIWSKDSKTRTVSAMSFDTAKFTEVSDTTALADKVLTGYNFYNSDGELTAGTLTLSGSSYTLLKSVEVTANTNVTTATSLTTITVGSDAVNKSKIIYVKIRDKAGKRAGYFYGSDCMFFNYQKANNSSSNLTYGARAIHRYSSSNTWSTYTGGTTTGYGVYAYSITSAGVINIYTRYNSSYSLTINGTYTVEIYALDFPNNDGPYV